MCASEWPSSVLFRRRFTFRRWRYRVSISHPADINVHWYLFLPRRRRFGERIFTFKGCLLYIIHGIFVQVGISCVVFIFFYHSRSLTATHSSAKIHNFSDLNRSRTHREKINISRLFRDTYLGDQNISTLLPLVAIK